MKKKILAVFLTAVMVLGVTACGSEEASRTGGKHEAGVAAERDKEEEGNGETGEAEEEGAGEKKTVRIAWCDDTQDATRAKMLDYMNERIEEIEAERNDIEIILDYYDANKSVDKQISDVEAACLTNPDVFIFSCVDSQGSLPCLQTMKDTGAYIIDIRDMGSDIPDIIFYGSDEETYKKATSSWIVDYMDANPDKLPLQVGLIYGAAAQTMQLVRCDLVKELAEEYPDKINIVAEAYADWDTQKAMNVMEDWIQAYPEINFVVCANDIMAQGASNALVAADLKENVVLTGIDLDGGGERIAEGKQDLDVGAAISENKALIDFSVQLTEGTYQGDRIFYAPGVMRVDATNADKYVAGDLDACVYSAE